MWKTFLPGSRPIVVTISLIAVVVMVRTESREGKMEKSTALFHHINIDLQMKTLGPCDIDLSRLNPTSHAIAVTLRGQCCAPPSGLALMFAVDFDQMTKRRIGPYF